MHIIMYKSESWNTFYQKIDSKNDSKLSDQKSVNAQSIFEVIYHILINGLNGWNKMEQMNRLEEKSNV